MAKKWEYKTEKMYLTTGYFGEPVLNEMLLNLNGESGWELASVISGDNMSLICIFKREKE